LNFTFDTDVGDLDLLGEVKGVGNYDDCVKSSDEVEIFGFTFRVLSLEKLIAAKRAAGRAKDLLALPELEAILEHRNTTEGKPT
jgi:predicted nucleotidyltransferase